MDHHLDTLSEETQLRFLTRGQDRDRKTQFELQLKFALNLHGYPVLLRNLGRVKHPPGGDRVVG